MAPWAHNVMLELRDYANEGGKLIVDGRNVHQPFTAHQHASLTATGPYTWTPDKLFGFYYPPNNGGDDDLPGTASSARAASSNDTWQNYLGVDRPPAGRRRACQHGDTGNPTSRASRSRPRPAACSPAWQPIALDAALDGDDPNQAADGTPLPRAACPLRLRNWAPAHATSRCAPSASRPTTPPRSPRTPTGGAVISTRDSVTFGFGLEQVERGHAQRAGPAQPELPAADGGGHHAADDRRLQVPAGELHGDAARPGRGRRDRVRRARRHGPRRRCWPTASRSRPPRCSRSSSATRRRPRPSARRCTLTAEAVDKAGNISRRATCDVNVVGRGRRWSSRRCRSRDPTIDRHAGRGPDADLRQRRVHSTRRTRSRTSGCATAPRSPAPRRRPTRSRHEPTSAATIACRMSATNSAGTGDATSEALLIVRGAAGLERRSPSDADAGRRSGRPDGARRRPTAACCRPKATCKLAEQPQGRSRARSRPQDARAPRQRCSAARRALPGTTKSRQQVAAGTGKRQGHGALGQAPQEGPEGGPEGAQRQRPPTVLTVKAQLDAARGPAARRGPSSLSPSWRAARA